MKEILIPLNFTTTPVLYDTKQSFSASDEESGVLTFTTTADVTGTVASLTIRNAGENANRQTVLIERLDVNSSPFSYAVKMPLPFGQYEGTVLLKKNLTVLASASFLFGVNSSLSAEVLPKLVEAYSLDNLVEEVETEVSNLKDAYTVTVSETVKGVNKTESTLQLSENVRYLNEATRKANELLRISQEAARVVAEGDRVTEFGNLVDSAVIEQTVTQEVAEKYQEIEATQANRLLSAEQQLAEAKADLQVGMGALTADAEVVTARSSTVTGVVHTVLDNRLEAIETAESLMATNVVPNGDFASGTTGWSATAGTIRAENGQLVLNEGITNAEHYAQTDLSAPLLNNVYYFRGSSSNGAAISLYNRKSDGSYESVSRPFVGGVASGKITTTTVYATPSMFVRVYGRTGVYLGANIEYLFDNVAVLNLTAIFGPGSDPTTEQMDRIMSQFQSSWFSGTKNLFLAKSALKEMRKLDNDLVGHVANVSNPHGVTKTQIGLSNVDNTSDLSKPISTAGQTALNLKANKVSEAWTTPTLVNGATGTFQYRKNEFGRLEFKGELTQASTASYFCITIAGYRPPAWIRCPITSIDGVVSMLIMSDGGALYLHTPLAGKTISFSGISINIQ